eukprot:CAMPEP_0181021784 /NCGR_PEP_ID=MMETSP1070-20121207/1165_1 /TAXON_ID=265543 /ORGANISM="Minutocellus polymorphus, Strain NH13" /LENGTH=284 /DNA_ID=CAMNT_0023098681 /DNA_START=53 /DNA_END=907 /DNA_ORIENTATION=+
MNVISGDRHGLLHQLELRPKQQLDDGHQTPSPASFDVPSQTLGDNTETSTGRDGKENKVDASSSARKLRSLYGRSNKAPQSGGDTGTMTTNNSEEQVQICWVRDVLVGQQAGHLAHLIGLLPFKLFSDIHDALEVSIRSSLNVTAATDATRNLNRRMRCRRRLEREDADGTDSNRLATKRTAKMFRIMRHEYLDAFHRNLDKCELWALRNVFTSCGDIPLGGLLHVHAKGDGDSTPTGIPHQLTQTRKEEHDAIDAEISELRKKLVKKKLELERNRKCAHQHGR